MTGTEMIAAERQRQIEVEGYSEENESSQNDLVDAAICYAYRATESNVISELDETHEYTPPSYWPWEARFWKPKDDLRNLVRAGALIAAAIDRLQSKG